MQLDYTKWKLHDVSAANESRFLLMGKNNSELIQREIEKDIENERERERAYV